MGALIAAFFAGMIFALGLGLGGMTLPAKVIGFLDVTGRWDPTLLGVMGGAVVVTFFAYRSILRRPKPVLDDRFHIPTNRRLDGKLLWGAALFGIGWGLGGYCPGPALTALMGFSWNAVAFVAAMFLGFWIYRRIGAKN